MEIHNVEQGSEAWHDLRCGRFTASKFKNVVAGLSTTTYKNLILETAGQIVSRETEPTYSNADMERGIELEPFAREEYSMITGNDVEEVGFITNQYDEYVGVSPDGLIGDDGVLEIKCPKMSTHMRYIYESRLPNEYKWQVQGLLFVTGRSYCDFMSYYPSMTPFIIRVNPDEEMHRELDKRLKAAIKDVQQKVKTYYDYLPY